MLVLLPDTGVPVEDQLRLLRKRSLAALDLEACSSYKRAQGRGPYGLPDHLTNKDWAKTNNPQWGRIVVCIINA